MGFLNRHNDFILTPMTYFDDNDFSPRSWRRSKSYLFVLVDLASEEFGILPSTPIQVSIPPRNLSTAPPHPTHAFFMAQTCHLGPLKLAHHPDKPSCPGEEEYYQTIYLASCFVVFSPPMSLTLYLKISQHVLPEKLASYNKVASFLYSLVWPLRKLVSYLVRRFGCQLSPRNLSPALSHPAHPHFPHTLPPIPVKHPRAQPPALPVITSHLCGS